MFSKYIVITNNNAAITFLEKINECKRTIPTLIINGKTYTNPGIDTLMTILENKS